MRYQGPLGIRLSLFLYYLEPTGSSSKQLESDHESKAFLVLLGESLLLAFLFLHLPWQINNAKSLTKEKDLLFPGIIWELGKSRGRGAADIAVLPQIHRSIWHKRFESCFWSGWCHRKLKSRLWHRLEVKRLPIIEGGYQCKWQWLLSQTQYCLVLNDL